MNHTSAYLSQEESETLLVMASPISNNIEERKYGTSLKMPYYLNDEQNNTMSKRIKNWTFWTSFSSLCIIIYLAYNLFRLAETMIQYTNGERYKLLEKEYASNGENVLFSSRLATIIIYVLGIIIISFNALTFEKKIKSKKLLLKSSVFALLNLKSMRAYLAFSLVFTIGKIFRMVNLNFNNEFETLTHQEKDLKEEEKTTVEAWKALFMLLVIVATAIKVLACFANIFCFKVILSLHSRKYNSGLYHNMYDSSKEKSFEK